MARSLCGPHVSRVGMCGQASGFRPEMAVYVECCRLDGMSFGFDVCVGCVVLCFGLFCFVFRVPFGFVLCFVVSFRMAT